jgi:dCTP deaminase
MLSDKDIKKALEDKWIEISPLDQGYIQPSSVDLRVGTEFRVFENHKYSHIDPKSPQEDLTTLVEASRIGLLIHSTAGFVDPGFSGYLTLELSNVANLPIKIYPEMKIGQISFYYLNSPSEAEYGDVSYGSKYQGQEGPTPSKSHSDFSS